MTITNQPVRVLLLVAVLALTMLTPAAPAAEATNCSYVSGQSTSSDYAWISDSYNSCGTINVRHKYTERGVYIWTTWYSTSGTYKSTPQIPELVSHSAYGTEY